MDIAPQVAAAGIYAGLNALILLWLASGVISMRRKLKISLSDKGDPDLLRRMRGHANATETMPIALILLFALALLQAPVWLIHALGLSLTAGRVIHGLHFWRSDSALIGRQLGMMLTVTAIAAGAFATLALALTKV